MDQILQILVKLYLKELLGMHRFSFRTTSAFCVITQKADVIRNFGQ